MSDITGELKKLLARRKEEGGEFSYVLAIGGEPITGKKGALTKLKELQPKPYADMKALCQTTGESEEAFDARVLKVIPSLPFEGSNNEAMDVEDGGKESFALSLAEMAKMVRIQSVKRQLHTELEVFLKAEVEGIESFRSSKTGKNIKFRGGAFDVVFKDELAAKKFLLKDFTFKEEKYETVLLKDLIRSRAVERQIMTNEKHCLQLGRIVTLEKDKEDNYLVVYGIGPTPTEDEVKEYFMGVESEVDNVHSFKFIMEKHGDALPRLQGILLQFQDKNALIKFTLLKNLHFKEKLMKYNILSDSVRAEVRSKNVEFAVEGDSSKEKVLGRRLVLTRTKKEFSTEVENLLKTQFPDSIDIRHCGMDRLTTVTFPTAKAATAALANLPTKGQAVSPVDALTTTEYLEIREKVVEKISKELEKFPTTKKDNVTEVGNVITVAYEKKVEKPKKEEKKKVEVKEVIVKPKPVNHIMKRRENRGANIFDLYIGVRGFNQHIKNMGKATDMDICNYFIHNHKDVADVKFVNWTDVVFAKFKTVAACEKFISLSYQMFYGVELSLHDIPEFLKKKSDQQKDEVARVLLGKKFNKMMIEGGGPAAHNGTTNGVSAKNPELELQFSKKQSDIRNLLIDNLHLNVEDVGQPKWIKSGGDAFKARFSIKLEENAIGYLVKKWNDMEITVEGETVKAELANATPAPPKNNEKRGAAKRGRRRNNYPGNKRAKMSYEDY